MNDIEELKRQGLSIQAIGNETGFDTKKVRRRLLQLGAVPVYGPRAAQPSKPDPFNSYLEERLLAGAWNAQVLLWACPRSRKCFGGVFDTIDSCGTPARS